MGGVDVLVLNHGGPPPCTASEMKEEDLVAWFQVIVLSPIRIAKRLLPAMRERGWGRIIAVGSTGMQHPIPTLALSNTLRASIWAWVKTMSGEVAPDGVTVNVLAPGTIQTDRVTETTTKRAQQLGVGFDEALAQAAKEIPAGRLGMPDGFRADRRLPGERQGGLRHRQHGARGRRPRPLHAVTVACGAARRRHRRHLHRPRAGARGRRTSAGPPRC